MREGEPQSVKPAGREPELPSLSPARLCGTQGTRPKEQRGVESAVPPHVETRAELGVEAGSGPGSGIEADLGTKLRAELGVNSKRNRNWIACGTRCEPRIGFRDGLEPGAEPGAGLEPDRRAAPSPRGPAGPFAELFSHSCERGSPATPRNAEPPQSALRSASGGRDHQRSRM